MRHNRYVPVPDLHAIAATFAQMPIILAIWWLPEWVGKWLNLRDRWQDR